MRDEFEGRLWAEHGHAFAADLARLVDELRTGFRRLVEIQFAAPWRRPASRDGR